MFYTHNTGSNLPCEFYRKRHPVLRAGADRFLRGDRTSLWEGPQRAGGETKGTHGKRRPWKWKWKGMAPTRA